MQLVTKYSLLRYLLVIICILTTLPGCRNKKGSEQQYFNKTGHKRSSPTLISSAHPEYPPIMWKNETGIVGIGPELLELLFSELDITVESNYTGPWTRVLENCKYGKVDAISALYYTMERSELYDYTISYMEDPVAVFVKKGRNITFEKWEDLIPLKGVTTNGDSWGEDFDLFMKENLRVTKVCRVNQCFRMIAAGRADYMIFSLYAGLTQINKYQLAESIIALPQYVSAPGLHIGFSKLSPYRKYIPVLNEKIAELKDDGTIDELINKHLEQ